MNNPSSRGPFWLLLTVLCGLGLTARGAGESYYQYRPAEFAFTANTQPAKPWRVIHLSAVFKGPQGVTLRLPGFWDGGVAWKIRFTPLAAGRWEYATECAEDGGLNGRTGAFTALPPAGDNSLYRHGGFLKPSANGRYLTYTDGTPFFHLGDTWWYTPSDDYMPLDKPGPNGSTPEALAELDRLGVQSMLRHCVEKRKAQGYTVIHCGFLGRIKGFTLQDYHTNGNDLRVDAWQEMDHYLANLTDAGLVPVALPLWSCGPDNNTTAEWKELMQYMVARYGAWPLHYGIGPEFNSPEKRASGLQSMAVELSNFVKTIDPYQRAASIQPWPWNLGGERRDEWDEPWLDYMMLEGGHESPQGIARPFFAYAWRDQGRGRARPLVLVETVFEGIRNYPVDGGYATRFNFYRAWQSGCRGGTYGAHGLWYPTASPTDQTFERDWGKSIPWWEALERPGGQQLAGLKEFYSTIPWWELVPCFDAISPALEEYAQPAASCIGNDDVITVYFPRNGQGTAFEYTLLANAVERYQARWFDPRAGTFKDAAMCVATGGKLRLPDRPDGEDWLLRLTAERMAGKTGEDPAFRTITGRSQFDAYRRDQDNLRQAARLPAPTVAASSSDPYGDGNFYRPQNVADGGTNTASYGSQWSNDCRKDAATQARPAWVELQWPAPIQTRTIVIYTMRGSEIRDYAIQYWDGAVWRVFGDAEVRGNTQARREHTVPTPVETTKIRFLGRQGAPGEPAIVRVVELQVIPDGPLTPYRLQPSR